MKIPKNVTEINSVTMSTGGYPVFDLMCPSYPSDGHGGRLSGYVSASGIAWYTEDDKLLKEFSKIRMGKDSTTEDELKFIEKHSECLIEYHKIKIMDHHAKMAYSHLSSEESRKETFAKKYYGVAFLVSDDKFLIFHQGNPEIREFFNSCDMTKKSEVKRAQLHLLEVYQAGKIKPEGEITDGAFFKLQEEMKDFVITKISEKEHVMKKEMSFLVDFSNEFNIKMDMKYIDKSTIIITLEQNQPSIDYEIKRNDENKLEIKNEGSKVWKEIKFNDLLTTIHNDSKIVEESIHNFVMKKIKL